MLAHNSLLAEIYETKDAEGNPVYTDAPVNDSSSRVELRETNTADALAPTPEIDSAAPPAPRQTPPAPPAYQTYRQSGEELYAEPEGKIDAEGRREVLDAEPRRVVHDAEPRRVVHDAEAPHEVLDAETPHEVLDAEAPHEVR